MLSSKENVTVCHAFIIENKVISMNRFVLISTFIFFTFSKNGKNYNMIYLIMCFCNLGLV